MPLDPVLHPVDPDPPRLRGVLHTVEPRPPQADLELCSQSRRAPPPGQEQAARWRLTPPRPAEPDGDGASPSSTLMLDDIETRLAHAPRDDISGLRWLVNLYQRLLEMVLSQPDAPESTRRRHWLRLRSLQRRLRSASSRTATR